MGVVIGLVCFFALIVLITLGRSGMIQENDKRVAEWARKQGVELVRVDRDVMFQARNLPPRWRIRVRMANGDVRDCIGRAGWSIYEPIEVEWAKPGESVFR